MGNLLEKSAYLASKLGNGRLFEHGPLIEILRYMPTSQGNAGVFQEMLLLHHLTSYEQGEQPDDRKILNHIKTKSDKI